MYQLNMVLVDDYDNIMKPNIEYGYGSIFSGLYSMPMKKNEWEFGVDYLEKNLIFKKIGEYKEPDN